MTTCAYIDRGYVAFEALFFDGFYHITCGNRVIAPKFEALPTGNAKQVELSGTARCKCGAVLDFTVTEIRGAKVMERVSCHTTA